MLERVDFRLRTSGTHRRRSLGQQANWFALPAVIIDRKERPQDTHALALATRQRRNSRNSGPCGGSTAAPAFRPRPSDATRTRALAAPAGTCNMEASGSWCNFDAGCRTMRRKGGRRQGTGAASKAEANLPRIVQLEVLDSANGALKLGRLAHCAVLRVSVAQCLLRCHVRRKHSSVVGLHQRLIPATGGGKRASRLRRRVGEGPQRTDAQAPTKSRLNSVCSSSRHSLRAALLLEAKALHDNLLLHSAVVHAHHVVIR